MIRYDITVETGDIPRNHTLYFVHECGDAIAEEMSDRQFRKALLELDEIQTVYGRFANTNAVVNLFGRYGFVQDIR